MMGSLTGGAFLIAYALLLGASNTVVGLISAVSPLTQILQIPSIFLVEKTQRRKALSVTASFWGRLFWVVIIALPFFSAGPYRLHIFLVSLFAYFSLNTISVCAFNSWIRDLVPDEVMGRFWADRMSWAIGTAMVVGLLAAFGIDSCKARYTDDLYVYSMVFAIALFSGMIGVVCLARIPEPKMEIIPGRSLTSILMEPLRDTNYRMLLFFLAAWQFAANLSAPFFAVYMLQRLNLSMSVVLLLSTLSQIVNVLFLRIWGRLADGYSNKSVLAICGPMFMVSVILWPFTTTPGSDKFALLLLIVIHVLAGVSTAGVT
ncbi:MAG TPA: MFS transporter, partial [bacterium]|nr:MFS transporter [bacterium]